MKRIVYAVVLGALLGAAGLPAADASFKIVVGETIAVQKITKAEASAIFLKKVVKLSDGAFVTPVDLPVSDPVREAFSRSVHKRAAGAVEVYWNRRLFAGQGVPPPVLKSSEEVLARVLAHPDTIAYVGADVELPAGTRELELAD